MLRGVSGGGVCQRRNIYIYIYIYIYICGRARRLARFGGSGAAVLGVVMMWCCDAVVLLCWCCCVNVLLSCRVVESSCGGVVALWYQDGVARRLPRTPWRGRGWRGTTRGRTEPTCARPVRHRHIPRTSGVAPVDRNAGCPRRPRHRRRCRPVRRDRRHRHHSHRHRLCHCHRRHRRRHHPGRRGHSWVVSARG